MTNYIINEQQGPCHYFYKPGEGLCFKEKKPGRWAEYQILYQEGADGFCAYCDGASTVHIICSNAEHEIVYLVKKNGSWNKYVLSGGKPELEPLEFQMLPSGSYLNLFYSARYEEDIILVHCVLGVNAQPATIAKLSSEAPEFFIHRGKVYYVDQNNTLGFQDYSDGKPFQFESICKSGRMPYLCNIDGTAYLVYKKDTMLCINGKEVFEDASAEYPVLIDSANKLILQWKSGRFIRYITSFNDGQTWSSPMRFISNGKEINFYRIINSNDILGCYGSSDRNDLMIYGKTELFPAPPKKPRPTEPEKITDTAELQKLHIMIDMMNHELQEMKSQVKKLKELLSFPPEDPQ